MKKSSIHIHVCLPKNGEDVKERVQKLRRLCRSAMDFAAEIRRDIDAICERDPAARSRTEVLLLYSGLHALILYRLAHALHRSGHYFAARLVSQSGRFLTGIEIHPGARIGQGLFIDHGSGVVIGETAIIGDNCTLYQGVTLGGTGKETGKRHPTLGNGVLVGAGAKLLGNFTVGDNAKIAAGAVVLGDVPEGTTAVGIPARAVRRAGKKICDEFDQTHIPDPVSQELCRLQAKLHVLEGKIREIENITQNERTDV
jgi:serine O-acetyltransferase